LADGFREKPAPFIGAGSGLLAFAGQRQLDGALVCARVFFDELLGVER
jgi:hypothetical protein